MEKIRITSLSRQQLTDHVKELGQPAFRAGQIFKWLHQRGVTDFSQMTDISKTLAATLSDACEIETLAVAR